MGKEKQVSHSESGQELNGYWSEYPLMRFPITHACCLMLLFSLNDASGRAQSGTGHWRLLPGPGEQPSGHLHSQPCPGIRGQDGEQSEVRSKPGMSVNILSTCTSDTCPVTFLCVIPNLRIHCRNIAWIIINSISKGEMKFG